MISDNLGFEITKVPEAKPGDDEQFEFREGGLSDGEWLRLVCRTYRSSRIPRHDTVTVLAIWGKYSSDDDDQREIFDDSIHVESTIRRELTTELCLQLASGLARQAIENYNKLKEVA